MVSADLVFGNLISSPQVQCKHGIIDKPSMGLVPQWTDRHTEKCKNIPARFREWLAEMLRLSAILRGQWNSLRVILGT